MASGQLAYCEVVNTAISTPFIGASNFDLVLRTDQPQQKLMIGNGSNTTPALSASNNYLYIANNVVVMNPFSVVYTMPASAVNTRNTTTNIYPKSAWSNISAVYGNMGSFADPLDANGRLVTPVKGIYNITFAGRNTVTTGHFLFAYTGYGSINSSSNVILAASDSVQLLLSYTGPFLQNNVIELNMTGNLLIDVNHIPTWSMTLLQLLP